MPERRSTVRPKHLSAAVIALLVHARLPLWRDGQRTRPAPIAARATGDGAPIPLDFRSGR